MNLTYVPRPGDIFLTQIGGLLGLVIRVAQGLLVGDWSRYTHAGIILEDGTVIAAQPRGARIDPLTSIIDDRPLAILPVPDWAEDRRDEIVAAARMLEGHPYGFLDYLYIGFMRLERKAGYRVTPRWLTRFVASDRSLICSAFADKVWCKNGLHLFDDGRLHGEVSPGDLAHVGTILHIGTGPYPEQVIPHPTLF
jgi:hypothetical protein